MNNYIAIVTAFACNLNLWSWNRRRKNLKTSGAHFWQKKQFTQASKHAQGNKLSKIMLVPNTSFQSINSKDRRVNLATYFWSKFMNSIYLGINFTRSSARFWQVFFVGQNIRQECFGMTSKTSSNNWSGSCANKSLLRSYRGKHVLKVGRKLK